ncbi:hypothetical protein KFK09_003419 [Dendrobium nobile]|uniref:Uncharacterized protein n=1 Tax=Dendrobium nobile TaxID=94219 RepID=A0A8T3C2I6_DENNO|nr:hypothetical protein KFK09_003419 [Dendrobium nobile]
MADPEVDHGFAYNDRGEIDILLSPFYEPNWEYDETAERFVKRILFCLAHTIDLQKPKMPWLLVGRYTPAPFAASSPPPPTFSWIKTIGISTVLMASLGSSAILVDVKKYSEGFRMQILAYVMNLYTLLFMVISSVTKQPQEETPESDWHDVALFRDSTSKEFQPPSPAPGLKDANLLSSILKRLGELEEKIDILQSKPSEMPHEKEELLDAAVHRVDALEAELIATK